MFAVFLPDGDTLCTDQQRILKEQSDFYKQLYTINKEVVFGLENKTDKFLNEADQAGLEAEITAEELHRTLQSMKSNKAPGCDGLTKEFYEVFWEPLQTEILMMYEVVLDQKKLAPSARKGVMSLIPKKGKDARYLKNLRPLTLLNIDYKLIAKLLADRMKRVLPKIIGPQQTGFMKNRNIQQNIRKTMDIVAHVNRSKTKAVVMSIDFAKCFDKIAIKSLLGALEYFRFP